MKKVILNFDGKKTKEQIHSHIAQAMALPDHYGHNADALYDCLTEISEPTCIGIYNADVSNGYLATITEVMKDAEADNQNLCVFFAQQYLN